MSRSSSQKTESEKRHLPGLSALCLFVSAAGALHLSGTCDLFENNLSGLFYLQNRQPAVLFFLIPVFSAFGMVSLSAAKNARQKRAMTLILLLMILSFLIPWKENPHGLQSLFNDLHVWLEAAGVLGWSFMMISSLFPPAFSSMALYGIPLKTKTAAGQLLILLISILICALSRHICGAAQVFFLLASSFWLLIGHSIEKTGSRN